MKISYIKTLPQPSRYSHEKWKPILRQILKENRPALVEFTDPQQKKKAMASIRVVISRQHRDTFRVISLSPLSFAISKKGVGES